MTLLPLIRPDPQHVYCNRNRRDLGLCEGLRRDSVPGPPTQRLLKVCLTGQVWVLPLSLNHQRGREWPRECPQQAQGSVGEADSLLRAARGLVGRQLGGRCRCGHFPWAVTQLGWGVVENVTKSK